MIVTKHGNMQNYATGQFIVSVHFYLTTTKNTIVTIYMLRAPTILSGSKSKDHCVLSVKVKHNSIKFYFLPEMPKTFYSSEQAEMKDKGNRPT
jgi:hypothetical protein